MARLRSPSLPRGVEVRRDARPSKILTKARPSPAAGPRGNDLDLDDVCPDCITTTAHIILPKWVRTNMATDT